MRKIAHAALRTATPLRAALGISESAAIKSASRKAPANAVNTRLSPLKRRNSPCGMRRHSLASRTRQATTRSQLRPLALPPVSRREFGGLEPAHLYRRAYQALLAAAGS